MKMTKKHVTAAAVLAFAAACAGAIPLPAEAMTISAGGVGLTSSDVGSTFEVDWDFANPLLTGKEVFTIKSFTSSDLKLSVDVTNTTNTGYTDRLTSWGLTPTRTSQQFTISRLLATSSPALRSTLTFPTLATALRCAYSREIIVRVARTRGSRKRRAARWYSICWALLDLVHRYRWTPLVLNTKVPGQTRNRMSLLASRSV